VNLYMLKTRLGLLNFLVLQWFFVRLQETTTLKGEHIRWDLLKGVVPLTGWWGGYVRLWGK
jgi:hypothetical protein